MDSSRKTLQYIVKNFHPFPLTKSKAFVAIKYLDEHFNLYNGTLDNIEVFSLFLKRLGEHQMFVNIPGIG